MFQTVFGGKPPQSSPQLRPFVSLNGGIETNTAAVNMTSDITVNTCINCISQNFAKIAIQHTITDGNFNNRQQDALDKLLSERPNEYNSAYDFLYKICYQLYINNNVFVYIKRDRRGNVLGLYPLDYAAVNLKEDSKNNLYCQFVFYGAEITTPYSNIIHLRRHYNDNAVYGGDGSNYLQNTLSDMANAKRSLQKALKNSGKIRGYLQVEGTVRPEDLQAIRDNFIRDTVSNQSNGSGIGALDSRTSYHQLTSDLKTADTAQFDYFKNEIYSYFGLNEKIINGTYSEAEYTAFYESIIKPLAISCEQEFSAKIFTSSELAAGHRINFATNRLEYSSIADKTKMAGILMQAGIFSVNEFRQLFGFAPLDGGDERLVSLNYQPANSKGGENDDG